MNAVEKEEARVLLTVDEVADLLRTSRKAVYSMVQRGVLPGAVRIGRRLLVNKDRLLTFVNGRAASAGRTGR